MTAAKILCELGGKPLCRRGVELARHVDEQDVFRTDGIDVECGGDGRVDAPRDTNDDALHVDAREEFSYGVAERAMDGSNRFLTMGCKDWGKMFCVDDGHTLSVRGRHQYTFAFFVKCVCSAREGVDGLALVLQAERIDIENRTVLFACRLCE